MQKLIILPTSVTPEIYFSPEEGILRIKGNSSPEDVRSLYYPVIDWMKIFVEDLLSGQIKNFNNNNPLRFSADLEYFNSSSAKFLYDIFVELRRLKETNIPVIIEWFYDDEDVDHMEAGYDIASLAGMEDAFSGSKK
ncbi:MAG: DUF1987 domain-containing protein [Bacteroidales bacterium]